MTAEDDLARTIETLRTAKGLSFRQLSASMGEVGCPIEASSLQKIEKGQPRRRITVDELVAFADVFRVPVCDLLGVGASAISVGNRASLLDIARQLLELAAAPADEPEQAPAPSSGHAYAPEVEAILSKPTMTVAEAAKVLHMGVNQVYAAVREHRLTSLRLGSRILIPRKAILDLLEGNQ